jgi:hypothetical protein
MGFRFWLLTIYLLALCLNIVQIVHGQTIDDTDLLNNEYDVKAGSNYTDLLNNGIVGKDDPEISCTGVTWGGETSTSCSLLNLTKSNGDFEKLRNDIDKNRDDYLKNLTGSE